MRHVKKAWLHVHHRWLDHVWIDWALVAVAVTVHFVWFRDAALTEMSKGDRMRVYTTAAEVSALVFGFATAAVAFFYGTLGGERVKLLKEVLTDPILVAWRACLTAPLLVAGLCVLALMIDAGAKGEPVVGWTAEVLLLLLALRCVRLRWLFVKTLKLTSLDAKNPQQQYAPGSDKPYKVAESIGPKSAGR